MFRFDDEDGENVVYWWAMDRSKHVIMQLILGSSSYELQTAPSFRRLGLGRHLLEKLIKIGKHWHMEKVMLTVLKGAV